MKHQLWIPSVIDRDAATSALVHSGYIVKQIERPSTLWPLTSKDYGIEYEEPEDKQDKH